MNFVFLTPRPAGLHYISKKSRIPEKDNHNKTDFKIISCLVISKYVIYWNEERDQIWNPK